MPRQSTCSCPAILCNWCRLTGAQSMACSPQGKGGTVLFVEDEPGVRVALAEDLNELIYDIHEASMR